MHTHEADILLYISAILSTFSWLVAIILSKYYLALEVTQVRGSFTNYMLQLLLLSITV